MQTVILANVTPTKHQIEHNYNLLLDLHPYMTCLIKFSASTSVSSSCDTVKYLIGTL